jgi:Fe-S cluster assembly iron-binding protein IscA
VLTLTPEAVRAVVDVVAAQDSAPGAGLRISAGPPSTFEPTWDYAVQREPFDGDVVVEEGPARVFVDADAAGELEQAVLDAHVDEATAESRFIIRR